MKSYTKMVYCTKFRTSYSLELFEDNTTTGTKNMACREKITPDVTYPCSLLGK
jgi:hypothetical protein